MSNKKDKDENLKLSYIFFSSPPSPLYFPSVSINQLLKYEYLYNVKEKQQQQQQQQQQNNINRNLSMNDLDSLFPPS